MIFVRVTDRQQIRPCQMTGQGPGNVGENQLLVADDIYHYAAWGSLKATRELLSTDSQIRFQVLMMALGNSVLGSSWGNACQCPRWSPALAA